MKTAHLPILVTSLALLSGCASNLPPHAFLPKTVDTTERPVVVSALGEVKVTKAATKVESHINPENFKTALTEVIKRANYFGGNTGKSFALEANIYEASFPLAGATMRSKLSVHYKLTSSDGKVILDKDIAYEGKATTGEEFFGSARALKAFQTANQGHFNLFLAALKEALQKQ